MPREIVRPMPKPPIEWNAPFSSTAVAKTTRTKKKAVTASSAIPAHPGKSRPMQILIPTARPRAEENQGKLSQESRDQLLRCAVHSTLHPRKGICARFDRLHFIWNGARSASLPAEIDQLCSGRPARRTRAEN